VKTQSTAAAGASPSPATPSAQADRSSFDPKTWVDLRPIPTPAARTSIQSRPGLRPAHVAAGGAGVIAVAALAVGLVLVSHHGQASPRTTVAAPATAETAPTGLAAGSAERRSLPLAGPNEILKTLVDNGVAAAEAQMAAAAATERLGPAAGLLRVTFIVAPGGAGGGLRLVSLEARRADETGVVVARGTAGAFVASAAPSNLTSGVRVVRSEMDANSFYTSAVAGAATVVRGLAWP
jgi:hypothetical protein